MDRVGEPSSPITRDTVGTVSREINNTMNQAEGQNPLAYPKSVQPFSHDLFVKPTAEYRGCPFWAWNTKLDKRQILRHIDYFKEMGMGGFHMHPRVGLDTTYLGDQYMDIVKACVDRAEAEGMLACLYDEDRWPSGSAGGRVTAQGRDRAKHLLFTNRPYGTVAPTSSGSDLRSVGPSRSENGELLSMYAITLDDSGRLEKSRRLVGGGELSGKEAVWYAYMEPNQPSSWFNGQTYVDTLSTGAISRFIEETHERYKTKVGDKFGSTIPCIFTDEPQFTIKTQLPGPFAKDDVFLPWTDDLYDTFRAAYPPGTYSSPDLMDHLPELIWDLADGAPSLTRYRYHEHVCERFVEAFMDQLGRWCGRNNLFLNGHMMEEPTLRSQTTAIGEAMRCYRSMQMPGIDLLNDAVEYNTAKQATSVARQAGRRGVMSEIYGCTHWYFTFEGHKGCGDWQAALGVTFRVHHLAWLSMAGEAKRDYPASINYQSPWYKEYGYVEDHFSRVGVAMTRGRPVTRVAVVHPIESFWMCFGPDGGSDEMKVRDSWFKDLTSWLLHGLIDFDFISESLLPGQFGGHQGDRMLHVGECAYEVVIVPNLRTVRSSTMDILRGFAREGGDIITIGERPTLVDGKAPGADLPRDWFARTACGPLWHVVPWDKKQILAALERRRDIRVLDSTNRPADTLLYQMRRDGDEQFVFLCNTNRNDPVDGLVSIRGRWDVQVLNTLTGETRYLTDLRDRLLGDWTEFYHRFEGCASLLLRLLPSNATRGWWRALIKPRAACSPPTTAAVELVDISFSEPNALMLDYARYRINGPWSDRTEVLRVDNAIRDELGLPRKSANMRQPWTVQPSDRRPLANVMLLFKFASTLDFAEPSFLALEGSEDCHEIQINGCALDGAAASGKPKKWIDDAIAALPVPPGTIRKGVNWIKLTLRFGVLTNIERVYVLGKFKVFLDKQRPLLVPWDGVTWGDITKQGLPFYAGNVTYVCRTRLEKRGQATLSVPHFTNPVLTVAVKDGRAGKKTKKGVIALQPRTLELGTLDAGTHEIQITAFGNRYNAFGHLHVPRHVEGCWPDMWRTEGSAWTDDYVVRPVGVLECPFVSVEEKMKKQTEDEGENEKCEDKRGEGIENKVDRGGSIEKEEEIEEKGGEEKDEEEEIEETEDEEKMEDDEEEVEEMENEEEEEDGIKLEWEVLSRTSSWELI